MEHGLKPLDFGKVRKVNVRIYHYPQGLKQYRLYEKPIKYYVPSDDEKIADELFKNVDEPKEEKTENICTVERISHVSHSRTIQNVYDISRSNVFEWFVTITFNPEKVNSFDYDEVVNRFSQWLKNIRKRFAPDLKYVFVPELHKSGRWHFHGLIGDCGNISFVDSGHKTKDEDIIYNIGSYKLGFTTATKIKDIRRVSFYITKYITKDVFNSIPVGRKRYWASRNLERPKVIEHLLSVAEQITLRQKLISEEFLYSKTVDNEFNSVFYLEKEFNEK